MKKIRNVTPADKRQVDLFSLLSLGACLVFYLFFAFYDKAVICVDSPTYINMDLSREPLYSLLLAFFRSASGGLWGEGYLTAVAFFQSVLAAFATWFLADYVRKECGLPGSVAAALVGMPLAVSLLCRFAARRGSMYSNSILTEGITISCYLIFFRFLLEYHFHRSKRSLFWCCMLSFLMISTRKQMVISLALLMICLVISYIRREGGILRGMGMALACAAAVLGAVVALDVGYNHALRGETMRHSSDGRFFTTMAFYTAEREDAAYIGQEDIRMLFLEIYDRCEEQGYLMHSAGEGWMNRVTHFGDHYDHIQIDTMWPAVNDYVREHYGDGVELNGNADRVMDVLNRALLPHNMGKVLVCFLDNFLSGLITTVAQRNRILNWYSLAAYLLYAVLLAWNLRAMRGSKLAGYAARSAGLTLLSIFLNVGLVSLVIFCQTRYTIYNMALFYMGLILMLYSFAEGSKGSGKGSGTDMQARDIHAV